MSDAEISEGLTILCDGMQADNPSEGSARVTLLWYVNRVDS